MMYRLRSSAAASTSSSSRSTSLSRRIVVLARAADAMCKDMVGERRETESQGKMYKIKFLASGGDFREVECRDNEYILDAADRQGVDLPATCRGGICGACVAKVCTGSVDMSDILDLEFTVNAKEQAEGMTLICMARPLADCNIEIQSDYGYSLGNEWKGATGAFNATPIPLIEKKK